MNKFLTLLFIISISLSEGAHMRILQAVESDSCASTTLDAMNTIKDLMQKVPQGDLQSAMSDLMKLFKDAQYWVQNKCWQDSQSSAISLLVKSTIFAGNACDDKVANGEKIIQTTVQHLQEKNYLALIGDLSSINSWISDFKSNCIVQSDACNAEQTSVTTTVQNLLNDLKAFNQDSTKKDGEALLDDLFKWKNDCVKPKSSMIDQLKLNLGDDSCSSMLSGFYDDISKTVKDLQDMNALALVGDATKLTNFANTFKDKCVTTSDDCNKKSLAISAAGTSLVNHLKAMDQANAKTDIDNLVDAFYTWKNACLKA